MSEENTKTLSQTFMSNHENITEDEAADLLVKSELKIREIKEMRAADPKLAAAKQITKDLNSSYSSTIKYEESKINFLLDKIAEIQNGEVNPTSGANN